MVLNTRLINLIESKKYSGIKTLKAVSHVLRVVAIATLLGLCDPLSNPNAHSKRKCALGTHYGLIKVHTTLICMQLPLTLRRIRIKFEQKSKYENRNTNNLVSRQRHIHRATVNNFSLRSNCRQFNFKSQKLCIVIKMDDVNRV